MGQFFDIAETTQTLKRIKKSERLKSAIFKALDCKLVNVAYDQQIKEACLNYCCY